MQKTVKKKTSKPRKLPMPSSNVTIRHILVPMDFSGLSRQALTCAVPLALKHLAKISLVHVVQSPAIMRTMPDGGITAPLAAGNLKEVAKSHLDGLADHLLPDGLRAWTVVREGNPANEVVAAAKALKADLIVLSSKGRSGISRMLIGSTAERIVRHAHCPVMTVRRQPGGPTMRLLSSEKPLFPEDLPWRRILVPVDLSLTSLRALQTAIPLAQQSNAHLFLLNVVEPNPYATGMEGAVLVMPNGSLVEIAKKQLTGIAKRFVPTSMSSAALVACGRASDVIVKTAEEKNVDLIVLSTHGHTGLDRLLIGSTAEQVVRQAKCPVLVVRKPKGLKQRGS